MKITNRQAQAHPANITTHELGQAMAQLDLASIPPEKRTKAVMEHLGKIMASTIQSPHVRAELTAARLVKARLT